MALGRIVSALVDARTPFYPNWFYFIVEAVAAAALFAVSLAPTGAATDSENRHAGSEIERNITATRPNRALLTYSSVLDHLKGGNA